LTTTEGTPVTLLTGDEQETTATVKCATGQAFGGGGEVTGISGGPAVIVASVPVSAKEWSVTVDNLALVAAGEVVAIAQCG
jgi:hypothetical protein